MNPNQINLSWQTALAAAIGFFTRLSSTSGFNPYLDYLKKAFEWLNNHPRDTDYCGCGNNNNSDKWSPDHPLEEPIIDDYRNVDPIVLDLDKNGINTICSSSFAYFDHDGNGFAEKTGWIAGGDGLLVMDRDGNGSINSGKELFGDQTILANGNKAANGFAALAELDKNRDGKIDVSDAAWLQLQVWVDNGDGLSEDKELKTLDELGIHNNICTQQSI